MSALYAGISRRSVSRKRLYGTNVSSETDESSPFAKVFPTKPARGIAGYAPLAGFRTPSSDRRTWPDAPARNAARSRRWLGFTRFLIVTKMPTSISTMDMPTRKPPRKSIVSLVEGSATDWPTVRVTKPSMIMSTPTSTRFSRCSCSTVLSAWRTTSSERALSRSLSISWPLRSSLNVTPRRSQRGSMIELSGRQRPVSHFDTAFPVMPSSLASCSCVIPSVLRLRATNRPVVRASMHFLLAVIP